MKATRVASARQVFLSSRPAPADEQVRLENSFFRNVRLSNGTHKTTAPARLTDLDPAVRRTLPQGWRSIDYLILGNLAPSTLADLPTVNAALRHSIVIRSFGGGLTIRKVVKDNGGL